MSKRVLILGMHRSGTSAVSQMLHDCGLHLGDDLLSGSMSNLDGHWESLEAVAINDGLLAASGGAWDHAPESVSADEAMVERMRAFLARLDEHPVSGWKDPRTILTLPAWEPLLGETAVVACLRNPLNVAHSLRVRNGWTIEDGLRLWLAYNARLLEYVRRQSNVIWFDYDTPPAYIESWIEHACQHLGLTNNPQAARIFDRFQRHHADESLPDDERIQAVYHALWYQAHRSDANLPARAGAAAQEPQTAPAETRVEAVVVDHARSSPAAVVWERQLDDLHWQVDQLGKVVMRQNAMAQEFYVHRVTALGNDLADIRDDARRRIDSVRDEIKRHGADAERNRQEIDGASRSISVVCQELRGVNDEVQALRQHASGLEQELAVLRAQAATSEQERAEEHRRTQRQLASLVERDRRIDELQDDLRRLGEDLQWARMRVAALEEGRFARVVSRCLVRLTGAGRHTGGGSPPPPHTAHHRQSQLQP